MSRIFSVDCNNVLSVASGFSLRINAREQKINNKRNATQITTGVLHRRDIRILNYVYI